MNFRDSVHPPYLQRRNRAIAQQLVSRFCTDAKHLAQLLKTQNFSQIGMKRLLFDIETYKIHTSESDKRACPVGNREPIRRNKRQKNE